MAHKNLSKDFQKKNLHQHIIDLPDSYIGSIERSDLKLWVFDKIEKKMVKRDVSIVGGLYKIFDEIIVNASDHSIRVVQKDMDNKVSMIKVNINAELNEISVYNNGDGIPIAIHPEEKIYIPEMIFANLLSSGNYDKDEEKIVGGKNGFGAKLTNIYSTKFILETVDHITKKKYVQEFADNMKTISAPVITSCSTKPYTKITFYPDLKRFKMDKLDDDILALMYKRVYDLTAITDKSVSVFLNDEKLEYKEFEKYIDLYIGDKTTTPRIYEYCNERWEVAVCASSDEEFEQVSFVNGVCTFKGGKHVEYISQHIANRVHKLLAEKKRNKVEVKAEHIKKNMFLFLRCSVVNPAFDSQTKEYMTTAMKDFGSKCEISDKFIEKMSKSDIIEKSLLLSQHKNLIDVIKTDTKRTGGKLRIKKLDDAEFAGTNEGYKCTLILTEGDSAKATAIDGLSVVDNRYYGVFPLKGKLLNVREATAKQLIENEEIINIQKIMGLQVYEGNGSSEKKVYNDVRELRYGHIMIFTDQDKDGFHIKGLLMNFINYFWAELSKIPDFICSLPTPLLKVLDTKIAAKKKNQNNVIIEFYSDIDYNKWLEDDNNNLLISTKKYDVKYFKGLGTSSAQEAKEYFKKYNENVIKYYSTGDVCDKSIKLGFDKNFADQRKDWLGNYTGTVLDFKQKNVSYAEFINRELIHFSVEDCVRSIPSMVDGLKPSQRKILYSAFKKNFRKEIKVSEFCGYVSEQSAYHHGEVSLQGTVIGMAQNFVGSNNINMLYPSGQFGTRNKGGEDNASPRYIYTRLEEISFKLFSKLDEPLLEYEVDDGKQIEPKYYIPILPTILINGSVGIGTGYSTTVLAYNPLDIISNIERMMGGEKINKMVPWYIGFKGTIGENGDTGNFLCKGLYEFINDTTVVIKELPVGVWTDKYKDKLDKMIIDKSEKDEKNRKKQCITTYDSDKNNMHVKIQIKMPKDVLEKYKSDLNGFEKDFGLIETMNISNMHLYSRDRKIQKYDMEGIFQEFYEIRLEYYMKRKVYWLNKYKKIVDIVRYKVKFIEAVRNQEIDIRKDEEHICEWLATNGYPKLNINDSENTDNAEGNEDSNIEDRSVSYGYLLNMQIRTLTEKRLEALRKEYNEKMAAYDTLNGKTEKDLWMEDLAEFQKSYEKFYEEYMELQNDSENDSDGSKKKKISIRKVKKV